MLDAVLRQLLDSREQETGEGARQARAGPDPGPLGLLSHDVTPLPAVPGPGAWLTPVSGVRQIAARPPVRGWCWCWSPLTLPSSLVLVPVVFAVCVPPSVFGAAHR